MNEQPLIPVRVATEWKPVRFVQIEVTTHCNMSCFYCAGRTMSQRHIAFDLFESILARLHKRRAHFLASACRWTHWMPRSRNASVACNSLACCAISSASSSTWVHGMSSSTP